jgi:hypothetical protein
MKKGKLNIIVFILSLSLIIAIGVYAYLTNQRINGTNTSDNTLTGASLSSVMESDYDVNEETEFGVCNGYIVECTKNGVKWIDKEGNEKAGLILPLDNPVLKISDSNILIANIDGRDVYSIEGFKVKWQKTLDDVDLIENSIINADIDDSGFVTVIQKAKRQKGAVTLIDPDGNVVFTQGKGEDFVLSALISPDSRQMMMNTYNTTGITVNSTLQFIDVSKIRENNGVPFAQIPRNNTIFSFIRFLNGNNVVAAGENFISCYNSDKRLDWELKLKKVYSVGCAYDKYIIAAVKSDSKNIKIGSIKTDIVTYELNGTVRSTFSLNEGVVNIKAFNGLIAVNTGRQVVLTDVNGNLIGNYSSKMDINQVEFIDGSNAAVITKGTINIVNF